MMNNDKRQERLVSLVRKLLELSRSNSNAHEAGLALSRAQRLMEKYGISSWTPLFRQFVTLPLRARHQRPKRCLSG